MKQAGRDHAHRWSFFCGHVGKNRVIIKGAINNNVKETSIFTIIMIALTSGSIAALVRFLRSPMEANPILHSRQHFR